MGWFWLLWSNFIQLDYRNQGDNVNITKNSDIQLKYGIFYITVHTSQRFIAADRERSER